MTRTTGIPKNCKTIQVVGSLSEFFNAKMEGEVSCILLPRELKGDFDGLARKIAKVLGYNDLFGHYRDYLLDEKRKMRLTKVQAEALDHIVEDMEVFQSLAEPNLCGLRVITSGGYGVDSNVNHFHQDGGPEDRVLAAYNVAGSHILLPEDVAGCEMNRAGSTVFVPRKGARIIELPLGSVWRQATIGGLSKPLIHSAPDPDPKGPPRLLLTA